MANKLDQVNSHYSSVFKKGWLQLYKRFESLSRRRNLERRTIAVIQGLSTIGIIMSYISDLVKEREDETHL